jgi:hypothetical protein
MTDERQDSIRQGIGAPAESETGRKAAEERRRRAAEGPEIGGGMGGTSDADSPGEEAAFAREQRTDQDGEDATSS